jgi:phosphatidylglycerol---prolipoprotein diacylglyceryl transferase
MLPSLQLGPLSIQTPGLVLLLGLWLGLSLAERSASRFGIKVNDLYNLVFVALAAGVVGARLVYILRYPTAFTASPISVLSLNPGLLDSAGGLAASLLAGVIYTHRRRIPTWQALDAITPALAVLLLALALAHLASGAAFGSPLDAPWAIRLWGERRHPSQVYEIIAALVILVLIWPGRGLIRSSRPGVYFLSFAALSAGARLFLEAFRGDSTLLAIGLRSAQVIAWVILAASLSGIFWLNQRVKIKEQNDVH